MCKNVGFEYFMRPPPPTSIAAGRVAVPALTWGGGCVPLGKV